MGRGGRDGRRRGFELRAVLSAGAAADATTAAATTTSNARSEDRAWWGRRGEEGVPRR